MTGRSLREQETDGGSSFIGSQKRKNRTKNKKLNNAGSTLGSSASRVRGGLTSPPTSAGVSRSAAKSLKGVAHPVSGSFPLRNEVSRSPPLTSGGAVQRSAGERQEGRHSPAPRRSRPTFCDRGLLRKRLWRLCLQHQSSGGTGLRECDAASGVCWTVGIQRADIS